MLAGNENITPLWLRARIKAIRNLLDKLPVDRNERNSERTIVRNGFIPENQQTQFNELVDIELENKNLSNAPLSFSEITSFNTWFVIHPEKICGKEIITTSRAFPITVKGSKEDIIRGIKQGISKTNPMKTSIQPAFIENATRKENGFANLNDVLNWTVQEFHSYYQDSVLNFQESQTPIESQISNLLDQINTSDKEREKSKVLKAGLDQLVLQRNRNQSNFENEYLSFCAKLHDYIIDKGREKGLLIDKEHKVYLADDILMCITDLPGIEHHWKTRIADLIEQKLQSELLHDNEKEQIINLLELDALALETELQLLKLK